MPCPARELGGIAPLTVVPILVAQAFLPVPQVEGGFACAKQGSLKTVLGYVVPAAGLGAITPSAVVAIS